MTALNELIKIIKQKRNKSEISNTLLKFVQFKAEILLKTEKEQQDELAIGFADWMISKAEKYNSYLCLIKDYKELLEIYKKEKGL
ncbi:MAG: hypothetical protein RL308_3507 [Bacteroidota bacterium]|jgi:hypothetical protein